MTKRDLYRSLCAVLGALVALLLHTIVGLSLLERRSGWFLTDAALHATRLAGMLILAAVFWRWSAHWWQVLYVEKRYGTPRL